MASLANPVSIAVRLAHWVSTHFAWCRYLRAVGQAPDQVTLRYPGKRFLSAPQPIAPYAAEHWEAAWLADAAYGNTLEGERVEPRRADDVGSNPTTILTGVGWNKWTNFPDKELEDRIEKYHLRVEVWAKRTPATITVAFGGTVFTNIVDWRANLRWFLPTKQDEYSTLVRDLAPAFVAEFKRRKLDPQDAAAALPAIQSTGHSLGGGLAQQFAYCLPPDEHVPRVTQVYAFDPSPVTGYFSVPVPLRNANCEKLKIDRIYERGEILAILRSFMSVLWKPSARAPAIRGVRYSLFYSCNPIAGHSMKMMATKLTVAAGQG